MATSTVDHKSELKAAEAAVESGDVHQGLRLAERVVFDAIEQSTGVRARGLLRENVSDSLIKAGLDGVTAETTQDILVRLESCRYGTTTEEPRQLLTEVRDLLRRVPSSKKGRRS